MWMGGNKSVKNIFQIKKIKSGIRESWIKSNEDIYTSDICMSNKLYNMYTHIHIWGFPRGSDQESVLNAETQIWFMGQEDPLEKEMSTHFSIPAWRIPWTEEPGELQSMGLQRVGHDWVIELNWIEWHLLSHVRLFATLWTVAHQGSLSMEFSRQEYWSG